jgi:hypothetical protein
MIMQRDDGINGACEDEKALCPPWVRGECEAGYCAIKQENAIVKGSIC